MKMKFFLCFCAIVICIIHTNLLQAQDNNPLIDSKDILQQGVNTSDAGDYAGAIKLYDRVSENDTNYELVLTEKSFSYVENKQYDKAGAVCREGLTLGTEYGNVFYVNLASSLDNSGKHDSAVIVYNEGIAKYPNDYKLYYNLGLTQMNIKDYSGALKSFQKSLEINPFHPNTNLQLGLLAARCGKIVPAMMAMSMYLM